ncbi:nicotinate-nucleotide--dimethylbenzimidazole phosphoribosyltransferase [Thermoactinomyces sp. CICC 10523]|nr:nicotinate-nucleotide--dimethylbenzimidazole phosphoribosyltransferase [Thermoactinomyces sp. CICC 10523]
MLFKTKNIYRKRGIAVGEKKWWRLREIPDLDVEMEEAARKRVRSLTKPVGSLGMLEEIFIRLAGITGETIPDIRKKAVVVMCGDHGVAQAGVSAYPQEVTGLMMENFLRGKAAVNVLAELARATVIVADLGSLLEQVPEGVIDCKVRKGTRNFLEEPAMTVSEVIQAVEVGVRLAHQLGGQGVRLIAPGEMGIGNTTSASALAAALTGKDVGALTGRGTGITDENLVRKQEVIRQALALHQPGNAMEALICVGGLEIAGMVGLYLGAAQMRMAAVMDGLISTVAAAIAVEMEPEVKSYLFASHLSAEPAHRILLNRLQLTPLITAEMRLGEASGASLAFPLFDAAVALAERMATFADLGLPEPD